MRYKFFESKFGNRFCTEKIKKLERLIKSSTSFTLAGMPGVGVTILLKYLATTNFAYFIYVDSYLLTNLTKDEFFRTLLKELGEEAINDSKIFERCLVKLRELSEIHQKIVIIFNRFDQLHSIFDANFFSNIWALRNINPQKIVIISTGNKPLHEVARKTLDGEHTGVFSRVVYLKPFSVQDLETMISAYVQSNLVEDPQAIQLAKNLCGGHFQLLQLLLKSARLSNPLQDQFIKLQLKELYEFITYQQRKILQKVALGKSIDNIDHYLIEIGLVKKGPKGFELFTPLLCQYITQHHPKRLPAKEAKFFRLLKINLGKVVSKETIFELLWPDNSKEDNKTLDWALNSLIYRLKKNPTFISSGYVIENHKKEGYILFAD